MNYNDNYTYFYKKQYASDDYDRDRLQNEAIRLMGRETVDNLMRWKDAVTSLNRKNVKFVIFMARRCYILFLLLESMTGTPLSDDENHYFLTDSGMLLQCEKLYEYYIHHRMHFPEIVIVDDVLIHGRNINNFLRVMEDHLIKVFEEKNSGDDVAVDYKVIRNAFAEAVTIRVFNCSKGQLLLSPRFLLCLEGYQYVELSELRQLSNQLSSLVLFADIANATYVISEKISAQQMERIKQETMQREKQDKEIAAITTVYQNSVQYLLLKYFKRSQKDISSIGIIRFIYNQQDESYRAIPLIILPQLDQKETDMLIAELSAKYDSEEFTGWLKRLRNISGKRMLNEFITLILSNSLLLAFNAVYGIKRDETDFSREVHKLARNYLIDSVKKSEENLTRFLIDVIIKEEDLCSIINKVTQRKKDLIVITEKKDRLSDLEKSRIRKKLEKRFYDLGWEDELSAVNCEKKIVFDTRGIFVRKNSDCYSLIQRLVNLETWEGRNYLIAIFFQMMDAGILSLSSFASDDDSVDGFRQFIKAGEQAMFLYPIAMYLYVPLLTLIEQSARLKGIGIYSELEDFFDSAICDIPAEDKVSIKRYIEKIYMIEQKMEEWNGNYYRKIDLPDEKRRINSKRQFYEQQIKYRREYQEFSKM